MSYNAAEFWKNFRLGTEVQVSGSFIYNALYFFDQMESFNNDEDIFQFLYNLSVGLERLEKIAVILLEHETSINQLEFEKTLITHSHIELIERIQKNKKIVLGSTHNKLLQLLTNFYKSMRYERFNLSSVYTPNQDTLRFIEYVNSELQVDIKTNQLFITANDDRIKNFIGRTVGKIVTQIYQIVKAEAQRQNVYTYELRYGSKPYKIFMCEEFTFHKENLLKKEIIINLMNGSDSDGFVKFAKQISPLLSDYDLHRLAKYIINPQSNLHLTEVLESIYDESFDKERMDKINIIGDNNIIFEEDI